jgi:hypothetical protein
MLGLNFFTFHILFKLMVVGKHGRKKIGRCWKGPEKKNF